RVLRDDGGGRRSRGRPGDRHRAVPAPRIAQPGDVLPVEMVTQTRMLLLIPLLPFLGFLVNASLGRRLTKTAAGAVAVGAMAASFVVALAAVVSLVGRDPASRELVQRVFSWISSGEFEAPFTLRLDPLSSVMILVVTGIGALIHLYS